MYTSVSDMPARRLRRQRELQRKKLDTDRRIHMSKRVIVIGGGASGMTAAIFAARQGAAVTLLEHMDRVGKKILSTGNGKCNLTNRRMDASCYRSSAPVFSM